MTKQSISVTQFKEFSFPCFNPFNWGGGRKTPKSEQINTNSSFKLRKVLPDRVFQSQGELNTENELQAFLLFSLSAAVESERSCVFSGVSEDRHYFWSGAQTFVWTKNFWDPVVGMIIVIKIHFHEQNKDSYQSHQRHQSLHLSR